MPAQMVFLVLLARQVIQQLHVAHVAQDITSHFLILLLVRLAQ